MRKDSPKGLLMARTSQAYDFRPVCQKNEGFGEKVKLVSEKTGTYICNQMGYDGLENVHLIEGNPWYWFAEHYYSYLLGINCENKKCAFASESNEDCAGADYYVELECDCDFGVTNSEYGCHSCPEALKTRTGLCKYGDIRICNLAVFAFIFCSLDEFVGCRTFASYDA